MIDFDTHLALTRLYADYALAVDSGQWELWPDFFADDCSYRLQPRENYDRGFPLCTLAFSSKGMLRDRVYGIKETLFHDPYYQRHVVGAPVVRRVDAGREGVDLHAGRRVADVQRGKGARRGRADAGGQAGQAEQVVQFPPQPFEVAEGARIRHRCKHAESSSLG